MRVVIAGRDGCCGGSITSTCIDVVKGYTHMSHSHLRPVGHDHESMASTAQVTPNPGRIEGQAGVSPSRAAVVSDMMIGPSRVCNA